MANSVPNGWCVSRESRRAQQTSRDSTRLHRRNECLGSCWRQPLGGTSKNQEARMNNSARQWLLYPQFAGVCATKAALRRGVDRMPHRIAAMLLAQVAVWRETVRNFLRDRPVAPCREVVIERHSLADDARRI